MSAKPPANQPDTKQQNNDKNLADGQAAPADTSTALLYTESDLAARAEELKRAGTDALQAENEELKKSLRLRDARDEITAALKKAGARSPELLFNSAKESLQFDAEGRVANPTALVERLQGKFPEQFGFETPAGSIDGGAGKNADTNYLTKEKLAKMTAAEISKLDWQDVRKVLAEG
jgi:hypothetical protein